MDAPITLAAEDKSLPVHKQKKLKLVAVVAALVATSTVGALVLLSPEVQMALRAAFLPQELKEAVYLSERGQAAYALEDGRYIPATSFSIVRQADGTYAVHDPAGTSLTFTGETKADLAISPDEKSIAYAELNSGEPTPRSLYGSPRNPKQWTTKVFYPNTGTTIELGEGIVPAFVDETHVLRRTSRGIFLTDLVSGSTTLVLDEAATLVMPTLPISPDGRHFAIVHPVPEGGPASVSIYGFKDGQATFLSQHVSVAPAVSYTLGNNMLYSIRIGTETEIWSEGLGEGTTARRVNTAPLSLDVSRILLSR